MKLKQFTQLHTLLSSIPGLKDYQELTVGQFIGILSEHGKYDDFMGIIAGNTDMDITEAFELTQVFFSESVVLFMISGALYQPFGLAEMANQSDL